MDLVLGDFQLRYVFWTIKIAAVKLFSNVNNSGYCLKTFWSKGWVRFCAIIFCYEKLSFVHIFLTVMVVDRCVVPWSDARGPAQAVWLLWVEGGAQGDSRRLRPRATDMDAQECTGQSSPRAQVPICQLWVTQVFKENIQQTYWGEVMGFTLSFVWFYVLETH